MKLWVRWFIVFINFLVFCFVASEAMSAPTKMKPLHEYAVPSGVGNANFSSIIKVVCIDGYKWVIVTTTKGVDIEQMRRHNGNIKCR